MKRRISRHRLIISALLVGALFAAIFISGQVRRPNLATPLLTMPQASAAPVGFAAANPSAAAAPAYPTDFPATPYPDLKGCSTNQENYLREAWRRAHYYTWRADKLIEHILAQPTEERRIELWNRDYIAGGVSAMPSPRRWFGPYSQDRASRVREAIDKARKRFEQEGAIVQGIKTLRCGQPILPSKDEHTDVCPANNLGSDGPPGGYHAPVGVIVTCPPFWDRANDQSVEKESRLDNSARSLVHETFHWLSVNSTYVTDLHAGKKYYGHDDSLYLAENKPGWAIYNNDNYAWFIHYVGSYEPSFKGVWGEKESGGTGGMFVDITWEQLHSWREKLAAQQYLSDVETYVRNGERRYTALWRIGKGAGAFWASEWPAFASKWQELKKTQNLIDIDIYREGDKWMFQGVYRVKEDPASGDGGLFIGLSWEDLIKKWKEYSPVAWLADVETYVEDGQRKFIGVWLAGKGNADLYWVKDANAFKQKLNELSPSKQLVDYEQFITGEGSWNYLGVWRAAKGGGVPRTGLTAKDFIAEWEKLRGGQTLLDVEEVSALPAQIK